MIEGNLTPLRRSCTSIAVVYSDLFFVLDRSCFSAHMRASRSELPFYFSAMGNTGMSCIIIISIFANAIKYNSSAFLVAIKDRQKDKSESECLNSERTKCIRYKLENTATQK